MKNAAIKIGTCSWKYDSWRGLVYSDSAKINYLQEYSRKFRTVEVDQWLWSLFSGNKVVLPKPDVVADYGASVDDDFRFGVKVANAVTLTHHYRKGRSGPLVENPHFLSAGLMAEFLQRLEPLHAKLGPVMLQFEYLNKQKMSGLGEFIDRLELFIEALPKGFDYFVELRNPNYLTSQYFEFLRSAELGHVFLQGYYMPDIFKLYRENQEACPTKFVIRLLGSDRDDIEKITGNKWDTLVVERSENLVNLVIMLKNLFTRGGSGFVFVNNHFEGSAPRTIERLLQLLEDDPVF